MLGWDRTHENPRDPFLLVWFKRNDINRCETRFSRHVWSITSSPYIATYAIQRLIGKNPTNVSQFTLKVIKNNRYMDDFVMTANSLVDVEVISLASMPAFESKNL